MITDLCVELLQEIGSLTSVPDQMALRSVSRQLRWAIEPLWFAANPIILDLCRPPDIVLTQLKALAAGNTGFSHISRGLVIRTGLPGGEHLGIISKVAHQRIQKLLRPALQSLKAVQAVEWEVKETHPDWARAAVVSFLVTSPSLEVLRLPEPLRSDIWSTLQEYGVQLREVYVEIVDDAFLQYLASYCGVERLVIRNCIDTAKLAEFFWESVVPRHADTLAELVCPAYYEGAWCFGTHNIARVSRLRRLESLEMTMNSDSRETGPLKEMVVSFLEMASTMPTLRNIAMLAAMPAREYIGRVCGTHIFGHMHAVQYEIDETVKSFGAADQSPEVARLIESHYRRSKLYAHEHLY